MPTDARFLSDRFPRSRSYNPDWLIASASGGANVMWLAEWLASALDLRPGMRILDLGCGRAVSSIFLHREFGVQVWATDLWCSAAENLLRICDAGVDDGVFPIHANARSLPFAPDFFDAIVCLDSYLYFGTDDLYLANLARFLKPGGTLGIAGAGLTREIEDAVPDHLRAWWTPDLWCLHSAGWWRRHWEKSGILDIDLADDMPEGWLAWREWHTTAFAENRPEIEALEADRGEYLGYVRLVARRRPGVELPPPIESVATEYRKQPLLRAE